MVIVGPGRLGRTAAAQLEAGGHRVRLVGRGAPIPPAPITWLTVPDRAIAAVAQQVPPGGACLHASGALDLGPLGPRDGRGSLHPLMTFPGLPINPFQGVVAVPAAVQGDAEGLPAALALARALGAAAFEVPGDRRAYHAAAVLAGNFATALLAEAAQVMALAGVPVGLAPTLLAPLALQSVENAAHCGPAAALTGPVARGDEAVIAAHRAALAEHPELLASYDALLAAARRLAGARSASGAGG